MPKQLYWKQKSDGPKKQEEKKGRRKKCYCFAPYFCSSSSIRAKQACTCCFMLFYALHFSRCALWRTTDGEKIVITQHLLQRMSNHIDISVCRRRAFRYVAI